MIPLATPPANQRTVPETRGIQLRADLPALTPNEARIFEAVKSSPPPAGAHKLGRRAGGMSPNSAKTALDRLIGKGYVRKSANGHYLLTEAAVASLPEQPPG